MSNLTNLIYVTVFVIIVIILLNHKKNKVENYNDQAGKYCITCEGKSPNECLGCFNCGFCVDENGNGKCIGGDAVSGPYNKERCAKWYSGDPFYYMKEKNAYKRCKRGCKDACKHYKRRKKEHTHGKGKGYGRGVLKQGHGDGYGHGHYQKYKHDHGHDYGKDKICQKKCHHGNPIRECHVCKYLKKTCCGSGRCGNTSNDSFGHGHKYMGHQHLGDDYGYDYSHGYGHGFGYGISHGFDHEHVTNNSLTSI